MMMRRQLCHTSEATILNDNPEKDMRSSYLFFFTSAGSTRVVSLTRRITGGTQITVMSLNFVLYTFEVTVFIASQACA